MAASYNGISLPTSGTKITYENGKLVIPDKPIIAGRITGPDVITEHTETGKITEPAPLAAPVPTPATLGLLAKGALALDLWRRE